MSKKESPTLIEFVRLKRQAECPVCQRLDDNTREQLLEASKKKIKRALQIEWLVSLGHEISDSDLSSHYSGRHEG